MLRDRHLETHANGTLEIHTFRGLRRHFGHLARRLGEGSPIRGLTLADLQGHVHARPKARGRRGTLLPTTIKQEVVALRTAWNWGVRMGIVAGRCPVDGPRCAKGDERPPSRSRDEIERQLPGLRKEKADELREVPYLDIDEVERLLGHVKAHASHPWIYPLLATPAHSGARRGELLRMRTGDLDLSAGVVGIRGRKRVHRRRTMRRVPLSTALAEADGGREGRVVGSSRRRGDLELLNARGRHRLGHPGPGVPRGPRGPLLNARGRHRLGHDDVLDKGLLPLLNARGRHRLGHTAPPPRSRRPGGSAQRPRASSSRSLERVDADQAGIVCSTPEGVIVSVTGLGRPVDDAAQLCSTPEGVIVSVTGRRRRPRRAGHGCSTPEGVIASVTGAKVLARSSPIAAQRPRASSPRSLVGLGEAGQQIFAAQRPRASSSRSPRSDPADAARCPTAQRPRASSSRSPEGRPVGRGGDGPCSTPEGVIVSVTLESMLLPGM